MAVNLAPPDSISLHSVPGVELGVAATGIRRGGDPDLLVMRLAPGTAVAGVFTRNRFCAAPVRIAKRHLAGKTGIRALVINAGNANAGTGPEGLKRAVEVCRAVAGHLGCTATAVLPFSTGVTMEQLPVERLVSSLPRAIAHDADWLSAARAMMTTDTVPKAASRRLHLSGGEIVVTGIAKGVGMLHPDMATMLAFICTNAKLPRPLVERMVRQAAGQSFNCVTVDGDTSTNDSFMLIATGQGVAVTSAKDRAILQRAITNIAQTLAQSMVRDGEGATKFVTVRVEGGRTARECRDVAYAISHSPLVKTAFFASDPNVGRILVAIGNAGVDVSSLKLYLDDILVATGHGRYPAYREEQGAAVMKRPEFAVRVLLGRGKAAVTVWTCDLSFDYVKINAEYRT